MFLNSGKVGVEAVSMLRDVIVIMMKIIVIIAMVVMMIVVLVIMTTLKEIKDGMFIIVVIHCICCI